RSQKSPLAQLVSCAQAVHTVLPQKPLWQSVATTQCLVLAHGGQLGPPQSTSVELEHLAPPAPVVLIDELELAPPVPLLLIDELELAPPVPVLLDDEVEPAPPVPVLLIDEPVL